jgi:hypothetical protein
MDDDDLTRTAGSIETPLANVDIHRASLDETDQGSNGALARLDDLAQEIRSRLSRLRWTINLWGITISLLLVITLFHLPCRSSVMVHELQAIGSEKSLHWRVFEPPGREALRWSILR